MNIFIDTVRQSAVCDFCKKPIIIGSIAVFGRYYIKGKIVKRYHWHIFESGNSCYIDQQVEAAKKRQLEYIETRGRKKLLLPEEQKSLRLKILQRRARLVQRLKEEMEKLAVDEGNIDLIIDLGEKLEFCKVQIEPFGGIPSSWIVETKEN